MRVLNERLADHHLDLTDGIKVFDERGWTQVLPDPDEPLLHLYAEGESREASEELAAGLAEIVEQIVQGEAEAEREPRRSSPAKAKLQLDPSPRRKASMEPLPDLAILSDEDLKHLIDELHAGGAGGLVPPPAPAREDRHPPRRAGRPAPEDGGPERARPGERRGADGDPRRQGVPSELSASAP